MKKNHTTIVSILLTLILMAIGQVSFAEEINTLMNKARSEGSVRVIVKLKHELIPEHTLGLSQTQTQRVGLASKQSQVENAVKPYMFRKARKFDHVPGMAMEVTEAGLQALRNHPDVEAVYEDRMATINLMDSVPLIHANEAWNIGYSGNKQTVAILDTGVDSTHPFLKGKVVSEACYNTKGSCSEGKTGPGTAAPCKSFMGCFHGTHVAGIAAGLGTTFSGVAKNADIIAIQVFDDNSYAYASSIIKALERVYALRNTYKIASINMSLGGSSYVSACDGEDTLVTQIINSLRTVGIATVVAAGNGYSSNSMSWPGCISTVVSVAASTKTDTVSLFSNSNQFTHLIAPGEEINSSIPDGYYVALSGTSMAAPHIAGAWAVLKSKNPNATVDDVLNAFRTTGKLIARADYTMPRIDVKSALDMLAIGCTYQINSTVVTFGENGGSGSFNVIAPTGCAWTADTSASWITITNKTGTGNGTVNFTVAKNTDVARTANITVSDKTYIVNQNATAKYTFTINKLGTGSGNVTVSGCTLQWNGVNGSCTANTGTMITITAAANTGSTFSCWNSGTGSASGCSGTGSCSFNMNANSSVNAVYTLAPVPAPTCSYTLSYDNIGTSYQAYSSILVNVTTTNGCTWTASSNVSWIKFVIGSGTGSGTAKYTLDANTTNTARSGVITIGGKTITVQQSGTPAQPTCTYSIAFNNVGTSYQSYPSISVNVTTQTGCNWTASSNVSWARFTVGSGSGSGTAKFTVDANYGGYREGTFIIAGKTFYINQSGR